MIDFYNQKKLNIRLPDTHIQILILTFVCIVPTNPSMNDPLINSSKNDNKNRQTPMSTNDKLIEIRLNVDKIKHTMQDNLEKVINRAESIDSIEEKTEMLKINAEIYEDGTRRLRRKICIKNVIKNTIIILVICVILGTIIYLIFT